MKAAARKAPASDASAPEWAPVATARFGVSSRVCSTHGRARSVLAAIAARRRLWHPRGPGQALAERRPRRPRILPGGAGLWDLNLVHQDNRRVVNVAAGRE